MSDTKLTLTITESLGDVRVDIYVECDSGAIEMINRLSEKIRTLIVKELEH